MHAGSGEIIIILKLIRTSFPIELKLLLSYLQNCGKLHKRKHWVQLHKK